MTPVTSAFDLGRQILAELRAIHSLLANPEMRHVCRIVEHDNIIPGCPCPHCRSLSANG